MGSALLSFENKSAAKAAPRMLRYQGSLVTYHADSTSTAGQFALLEIESGPGGEPPLHVHRNEDELFYVLEGYLSVLRGDEEITLGPGESAFLPRGVKHTFKIVSSCARFLVYITPGGFEAYFRDLGEPVNEYSATATPRAPLTVAEMIRVAGRYSITFMP